MAASSWWHTFCGIVAWTCLLSHLCSNLTQLQKNGQRPLARCSNLIQHCKKKEQLMAISFNLNGKTVSVTAEPDTPLLWVIRDEIGLTGTKFGCGAALCGACTVHLDGAPVRSCQTPVSAAAGKKIATVESLSKDNSHPLQKAWIAHDVPQCGYCQSGQLMSAAALLSTNKNPSDGDIDNAMSGNLCRCGTYNRIRAAIKTAAAEMRKKA
jgi:isoquinoline 1-oxidoreductase alpha subunit